MKKLQDERTFQSSLDMTAPGDRNNLVTHLEYVCQSQLSGGDWHGAFRSDLVQFCSQL